MNHTTESAPSDIAADLTQLRADFSRLSESVAGLVKTQAQTAAGSLRDTVAAAGDRIAGKAADLGNSAVQLTSGAEDKVRSASHDIEASIERNPLTAVIIAAGIGMVIGLATSRS
jgi:ElaB/YqjD/DUF883 family membrane-anchored ribosome-binding protein